LAPSLVRAATGSTSNLIGGALVAALTLTGALSIYTLRNQSAEKMLRLAASLLITGLALVLIAAHTGSLPLFFIGTLVTGSGFGAGFLGALRSIMPLALPHERAGLMSAFYVLSYLAFSLPSLLAGNLTRVFGLIPTTDGYGLVLILLASAALLGLLRQAAKPAGDGVRP
jgi:MFS family permease